MYTNTKTSEEIRKAAVDIVTQNDPKWIPSMSQMRAWPIFDAGYVLSDALKSEEKMLQVACNMTELYGYDFHWNPAIRFPYKVYDAIGSTPYIFDDENQRIEYLDGNFMEADEYEELIEEGVVKFYFEKVFPRRFSFDKVPETERNDLLVKAMYAQRETSKDQGALVKYLNDHYGSPAAQGISTTLPAEDLFMSLRGIKGMSLDLRRKPDLVEKALDVINDGRVERECEILKNYPNPESVIFPLGVTMLAHNVCNAKQFERFCWKHLKQYVDAVNEGNVIGALYIEGSLEHLLPFFQDIPKNRFMLLIENSDMAKLKKDLPNLTFAGGMPTTILGPGTVEEVKNFTKKFIDEVAYDGRIIISTDKMLAFPCDARRETLLASNEVIREYGIIRR